MKKINKTLAIAALAVASTFAAQSAKAQETFDTDFGTTIEVEAQPQTDFSISSFDNEAYINGGVVDRGFMDYVDKGVKLAKMLADPNNRKVYDIVKDMCKNCKNITVEDVIAKLKSVGHGILVATVSVGTISFFIGLFSMI